MITKMLQPIFTNMKTTDIVTLNLTYHDIRLIIDLLRSSTSGHAAPIINRKFIDVIDPNVVDERTSLAPGPVLSYSEISFILALSKGRDALEKALEDHLDECITKTEMESNENNNK